jgi:shikimate dehydrogenase
MKDSPIGLRSRLEIDRYALVGHPVSHSWSPFIHGMFAKQTGRDLQYRLIDAAPGDFERVAREFLARGGRGLNVTVPYKQEAAALADELTGRARRAGAVNTVAWSAGGGLLGDNTDGTGLIVDLTQNLSIGLAGTRILLLGAGGASRGVIGPLLDARPALLHIANRSADRARELAGLFAADGPVSASGFAEVPPGPYDLVINATSASLSGEVPALPSHCLGPRTVAYDMAYAKEATVFMRFATANGAAAAHAGWGMLVEQAAEAYLLWRGIRPDTRHVLSLLTQPGRIA